MTLMKRQKVEIEWSDSQPNSGSTATITYPCGHVIQVQTRVVGGQYPAKNGPMSLASKEYRVLPDGEWQKETAQTVGRLEQIVIDNRPVE